MTWGENLWDQIDKIAGRTQYGIEFMELFSNFLKEKSAIDVEYAKHLGNLVKKYQSKKKEDEDDLKYSYIAAFNECLVELQQIAVHHNFMAEYYKENMCPDLATLIRNLKDERKYHLGEITRLQQNLKTTMDDLSKMKKQYTDACKTAEDAQNRYQKAEIDMSLSVNEVERKKSLYASKMNAREDAQVLYASQLQQTNDTQIRYYDTLLPNVINKLEEMDGKRIENLKTSFVQMINVDMKTMTENGNCLQNSLRSCDNINAQKDAQLFAERYKSGQNHPGDIALELSNRETEPAFRSNGLKQKIDYVEKKIKLKTEERNACLKMATLYSHNPDLGDANKLKLEVEKYDEEIKSLAAEMHELNVQLQQAPAAIRTSVSGSTMDSRRSSQSTLRSSAAKSPGIEAVTLRHRNSGFSDRPTSKGAFPFNLRKSSQSKEQVVRSVSPTDSFDDFDDEPSRVIGNCVALYDFTAASERTISIKKGEHFFILERDCGDGWTKVRNKSTELEGFVPTTYVSCNFY